MPPSSTTTSPRGSEAAKQGGARADEAVPLLGDGGRGASAKAPQTIDWPSLLVVYLATLVCDAARGLLLPSVWPYLRLHHGTKSMLGLFVSMLSTGRMLGTYPLGRLSDSYPPATVLIIGSAIQAAGHLVYAVAPNLVVLYAARVVVGLGSTLAVCRAHVARAIPPRLRTHHFAYLSGLQFLGYAVLPGPGGMMAGLPRYSFLGGRVQLNGFTYPAFTLVLANLLVILLVRMFYIAPRLVTAANEDPEGEEQERKEDAEGSESGASDGDAEAQAPAPERSPDYVAVGLCLAINVLFRGVVAQLETITVPFLMEQYGVTYETGSMFLTCAGLVGLAIYMMFKPIARAFSDRFLVGVGLAAILFGCAPLAVHALSRELPLGLYVVCLGLTWSIAYPVGQTATLALFSKVLADLPVGGLLGVFSMAGSTSRLVFASVAGWEWGAFGRDAVFGSITVFVGIVVVIFLFCYRRLAGPAR